MAVSTEDGTLTLSLGLEYNFEMVCRKGTQNSNADALSCCQLELGDKTQYRRYLHQTVSKKF